MGRARARSFPGGSNAQTARGSASMQETRPPDRRSPYPRRAQEPLRGPRHRRIRSRGMTLSGKGAPALQARVLQQYRSDTVVATALHRAPTHQTENLRSKSAAVSQTDRSRTGRKTAGIRAMPLRNYENAISKS